MSRFNFGKKNKKEKEELEKEKQRLKELEKEREREEFVEGTEDVGEEFFADGFDKVHKEEKEEDLLSEVDREIKENKEKDEKYAEVAPKKREKLTNVIIVGAITVVFVVGGLIVFREPIREFIGVGSGVVSKVDVRGEVDEYKENVTTTLKEDKNEVEGEVEKKEISEEVAKEDKIGEGMYVGGSTINTGVYLAENVLVEKYPSREQFEDGKPPTYTNVSRVTERSMFGIYEGEFIIVEGGSIVNNRSRKETKVNVGDTVKIDAGKHVAVGKDLPEGFYKAYNMNVLEDTSKERVKKAKIEVFIGNSGTKYEIERKSVIFLPANEVYIASDDIILERIASDGTGGNHKELLEELSEDSENE